MELCVVLFGKNHVGGPRSAECSLSFKNFKKECARPSFRFAHACDVIYVLSCSCMPLDEAYA